MQQYGLLSVDKTSFKRSPIPFKGSSVQASIEDFCCVVTIIQTYKNDTDDLIEAVYRFPLHERSAINRFVAWIDSKKLVGQIQTSEKAQQTYDDAVASGKGAYLLEKKEKGIYEMSVGALPPQKEVKIEISYISDLDFEGNDIVFELPTSICPTSSAPISNGNTTTYVFDAIVHLNMTRTIQSLRCPSYSLQDTESVIGKQHGTFKTIPSAMGAPFRLSIGLKDLQLPAARTEVLVDGNSHSCAVMVNFCPEIKAPQKETETEIIFVLDRSGSMGGVRITAAKKALLGALNFIADTMKIRPVYFNVFGFGSNWTKLFDDSELATEKSISTARAHFEHVRADQGGTEILPVLKEIQRLPGKPGRPRNIVLLTDGEVGNDAEVILLVQKMAATSRVFPFGIGPDVSRFLVSGIARASNTRPEFVSTEQASTSSEVEAELLSKVSRQIARSLQPVVMNVKMDWGGLAVVHQSPVVLPALWSREPYVIFAQCTLDNFATSKGKVYSLKLSGETQEGEVIEFSVSTKLGELSATNLIHSTVARAVIFDLESKDDKKAVEMIVSLSKKYTLVSQYTSFVAVEEREEANQQAMKIVTVPQPVVQTSSSSNAVALATVIPSASTGAVTMITGAICWRTESIVYKRNELFVDFIDKLDAVMATSGDVVKASVECSIKCKSYLSGMPEVKMKVNVPAIEWYNIGRIGFPEVYFHQCVRTSLLAKEGVITCIPPDGDFQIMRCIVTENYTIPFKVVSSFFKASPTSLEITLYVKSTYSERQTTNVAVCIPIPPDSTEQTSSSKGQWGYAPEADELRWKIRNFQGGHTEKLSVTCKYNSPFTLDNSKDIMLTFEGTICVSGGNVPYVKVIERSGYKAGFWYRNYSEGTIAYRWGFPKL